MRFRSGSVQNPAQYHPPMDLGGGGDALRAALNLNPVQNDGAAVEMEVNDPMMILLGVIPGHNALDISPAVDGKLWKEVLFTPANNEDLYGARMGMEVKVHYTGTLVDGTVFDANHDRDTPFAFTLGEDTVIQAWEKGVLGMRVGQIVKLITHPDFAYGDRHSGHIPPNSTLIFEIIMVDYKPEDLTKKKDGSILRYNVKVGGSKYLHPNHGGMVAVSLSGKYKDIEVYTPRTKKFRLGEGCDHDIPYGVEKALYKFRSGESSVLIITGAKYGIPAADYVKYGITPDTPLEFHVELLSLENTKEPWQLDGPEKLEVSRSLKDFGNSYFAKANYRAAFKNYKLIVTHLKAEALLTGDDEVERKRLLHAAYLNLAICNLKLSKPTLAIRNCDDALALDAKSTKALFRRGLAYLEVNLPDFAKPDFRKVLELEPSNTAASQQIIACDLQMKENLKKEKQIYSKMFSTAGSSSKSDAPLPNAMENVSEWGEEKTAETNGNSSNA